MEMSLAVYYKIQDLINNALRVRDVTLLEIQTQFVLMNTILAIPVWFSQTVQFARVTGLKMKESPSFLFSETNVYMVRKLLDTLKDGKRVNHDFSHFKLDFDLWFFEMTSSGWIDYVYDKTQLVSADCAARILLVSKPTIYNYLNKGMEYVEVNGNKKIPLYVLQLWSESGLALKLQLLAQQKKDRIQSIEY
ncbi:hypothetical protein [Ectobacillus sp. sgz5001026]|uniref:hypothetical protein n=1 Tax=Ectobacillus sp. sgz5001026 TaxID=3242473 RepID=UPI0036D28736